MLNRSISEIYLDANATTPVWPEAAKRAVSAMEELFGNPSSSHITGLRARSILESAREMAKSVLGAESGRIVFTSGATEAIQMGIFSTLCSIRESRKDQPASAQPRVLLYGATEHKAVPQALKHWNDMLGIVNRYGKDFVA
ncbi:MAG: aminotransferase class V-fold PLP-dependent enzyme, partial [Planctomycetota bacterium]